LNKRLIAVIAGALAIALVVVGCGGGSDDEAPPISKAELIKKGDAICEKGGGKAQTKLNSYVKENKIAKGQEPTDAQFTEISEDILVPAIEVQIDEIRALGAPDGDEEQVEEMLDVLQEGIEGAEDDPVKAVKETSRLLAKGDKLLQEYGFEVCGGGGK
jgi:hypothetical protein